jgi:hypothetical protein
MGSAISTSLLTVSKILVDSTGFLLPKLYAKTSSFVLINLLTYIKV